MDSGALDFVLDRRDDRVIRLIRIERSGRAELHAREALRLDELQVAIGILAWG